MVEIVVYAYCDRTLTRNGVVYAIGGVSANPDQNRGRYSAYSIWQERTLDALWRLAVLRM